MLPGASTPSPWPFSLRRVHSVNQARGPRAQPAQLSPPAEPRSLRALVGGSPCALAAGSGQPAWGQPQLRAEQPFGQSRAPGCPRWVLLSAEMFVAGPKPVLQDPFMTWISEQLLGQQSTAPASIPGTVDLQWRKGPQELPGVVLRTVSPAWTWPAQVATSAGIHSGSGEAIVLWQ